MDYMEFRERNMQSIDSMLAVDPQAKRLTDLIRVKDTKIIPNDAPLLGKYGYTVLIPNHEGEPAYTIDLQRVVHGIPKQIRIESYDEFEAILNNSLMSNFKVELYERPEEMLCGFLVFQRNEIFWYHISFVRVKEARLEYDRRTKAKDTDSSSGICGGDRTEPSGVSCPDQE